MGCYREGTAWMETHNNLTKRSVRWWLSPHWRWTEWVENCWVRESRQRPRPARTHSQESAGLCAAAATWTGVGSPSGPHSGALWHSAHLGVLSLPPGKRVDWSPRTRGKKSQSGLHQERLWVTEGWAMRWQRGGKPRFLTGSTNNSLVTYGRCFLPLALSSSVNKMRRLYTTHLLVKVSSVSSHSPGRGFGG